MLQLPDLTPFIPFLIPVAVIELGLLIAALVSILRHKTYRAGNRVLWIVLVIVLNIIGPILYFAIGRGEE
jgi:hypothetical protein